MRLLKRDYSKEDVEVLKNILHWEKSEFVPPRSTVCVRNKESVVYMDDLLNDMTGNSAAMAWFLHYVPFEDVPLYIHDFPELARWRLMIAR
jgi:hypothetical protein